MMQRAAGPQRLLPKPPRSPPLSVRSPAPTVLARLDPSRLPRFTSNRPLSLTKLTTAAMSCYASPPLACGCLAGSGLNWTAVARAASAQNAATNGSNAATIATAATADFVAPPSSKLHPLTHASAWGHTLILFFFFVQPARRQHHLITSDTSSTQRQSAAKKALEPRYSMDAPLPPADIRHCLQDAVCAVAGVT